MNIDKQRTVPKLGWAAAAEPTRMVQLYSVLAFLALGIFGTIHTITDPEVTLGYMELAGSAVTLLNIILLRTLYSFATARAVFLLTVLTFLLVMLITGGTAGTGAFWFFTFPVAAFFLAGTRQGLWWMVALFGMTEIAWVLATTGVIKIVYDDTAIQQLLISTMVVTAGIYFYQHSRESLESQTRASQHELHSEQVRADEIVRHIDEGIITTDANGVVTYANQAAVKLLGWSLDELQGKQFIEMVPMLDSAGREVPAQDRPLHRALRTGETSVTMATYRRKDGQMVPVSVTGTSVTVDGKVVGAIGTFRDISEEQGIARAKSEFVTLASHQLRTPISAISWLSELLLNGDTGKLTSQQREHIEGIYHSNQRMANLVSEMLLVSSLEVGSLPIKPQQTDLAKLATTTVKEQVDLQKKAPPEVTEQYDPALPSLACDPDVIRLLLSNLLSNALKYTPEDGTITLNITADQKEKLYPGSKGSVVIKVSDTGYGIPENATNKIFSKFFRAGNIIHKDTDGTGLGLFIVKALLDYVGGRISFTSREGKGTAFTVLLPLEGMLSKGGNATDAATAIGK